jgi:hypothetical protein
MFKINRWRWQYRTVPGFLMSLALANTTAIAQQISPVVETGNSSSPAVSGRPSKTEPTMDEMLATIKRLEERVRELERLTSVQPSIKSVPAAATIAESQTVSAPPSSPVADAKKEEEEKQNNGILSFFRATEVSGFVDAYYGYNFNRPTNDNQLRNFDTKHNQFSFNMAELALEKKPIPDSRLGFRMDLNFGPTTDIVHSFEPAGSETFRHLQQAYISYLAPAGNGLQFDVGKFVTPHGAEVIETKDNWNYSRSLLFALAIPYYHFGVRATYPVSDKLSLSGFVVNGWNNVVDNNSRKSYGAQAIVKPTSKLTIIQNYMGGPEQTGNNDDWRHLWDTTVTYTVNPTLSLMGNYDYGFDRVAGARVHWQGFAAYAKVQANNWLAFAPRFEWYNDHDGFTTGAVQSIKDFTLTSEHKISNGLITRLEYRRDFSDTDFFIKPTRLVKAQSTLSFGLIYAFSSKGEQ